MIILKSKSIVFFLFAESNGVTLLFYHFIMHLNVRSLNHRMDMIKICLYMTTVDIMILLETWLKKSVTDDSILRHFIQLNMN